MAMAVVHIVGGILLLATGCDAIVAIGHSKEVPATIVIRDANVANDTQKASIAIREYMDASNASMLVADDKVTARAMLNMKDARLLLSQRRGVDSGEGDSRRRRNCANRRRRRGCNKERCKAVGTPAVAGYCAATEEGDQECNTNENKKCR